MEDLLLTDKLLKDVKKSLSSSLKNNIEIKSSVILHHEYWKTIKGEIKIYLNSNNYESNVATIKVEYQPEMEEADEEYSAYYWTDSIKIEVNGRNENSIDLLNHYSDLVTCKQDLTEWITSDYIIRVKKTSTGKYEKEFDAESFIDKYINK